MVAGAHEQPYSAELQVKKLADLQRSLEAAGLPYGLVRSEYGLGAAAYWQPQFNDAAIQACLALKVLFGLALW